MRRILLAPFLLAVIGFASAAVLVTLNIPGTVTVVNPSLQTTPSSLNWGSLTVNATHGASASQPLSIMNNGGISLTIAYSCICPTGFSLALSGQTIGTLAPGGTWAGSAILTIAPGTAGGTYAPTLVITGLG